MEDKLRKYKEAYKHIQDGYEIRIDKLGYDEHRAFSIAQDELNGLITVAIYDREINPDEFWMVNEMKIRRREDD